MKNFVIKLVKNNPFLYQSAKKVYRTFQPARPTVYRSSDYRVVYRISDPAEMPERYPGVIFYSMDYYRTYQKRLYINNMILTGCRQPVGDIIDLL